LTPLRAYGLLRAVALPAGQWRVEWRFQPAVVYLGLAVSLTTLIIILFSQIRNVFRNVSLR
jgi:uncharacterized membrane protein YfhO